MHVIIHDQMQIFIRSINGDIFFIIDEIRDNCLIPVEIHCFWNKTDEFENFGF